MAAAQVVEAEASGAHPEFGPDPTTVRHDDVRSGEDAAAVPNKSGYVPRRSGFALVEKPRGSGYKGRRGRGRGGGRGGWRGGGNKSNYFNNEYNNRGGYAPQGYYVQQPYFDPATVIKDTLEYYFSIENLVKDVFLRSQMNEKGYIPLKVLSNFNRMKMLTNDDKQLLKCARAASALKVKKDCVRKKEGWHMWTFPPQEECEESSDEEVEEEEEEEEGEQGKAEDGYVYVQTQWDGGWQGENNYYYGQEYETPTVGTEGDDNPTTEDQTETAKKNKIKKKKKKKKGKQGSAKTEAEAGAEIAIEGDQEQAGGDNVAADTSAASGAPAKLTLAHIVGKSAAAKPASTPKEKEAADIPTQTEAASAPKTAAASAPSSTSPRTSFAAIASASLPNEAEKSVPESGKKNLEGESKPVKKEEKDTRVTEKATEEKQEVAKKATEEDEWQTAESKKTKRRNRKGQSPVKVSKKQQSFDE